MARWPAGFLEKARIAQGKIIWLVGSSPLKNMKVSWDDDIPN
jgi:hypothetical protein